MFGGPSEDFVIKIRSHVNPGFHLSSRAKKQRKF